MPDAPGGPATPARNVVRLAGRDVTIEPVSGRKASRAFAILRTIGKDVPAIVHAYGEFEREYQASHTVELDRVQAIANYPAEPLVENGRPLFYPAVIELADGQTVPHPRAGEMMMVPSPLESMTEADWEASDQKLRRPRSPSVVEAIGHVLPAALDVAEESVYELLALFTVSNDDVKRMRRSGSLDDHLKEVADDLLDDALMDEILELAVVAGETVDDQFTSKAKDLGDRLGKALRLVGLDPTGLQKVMGKRAPQTAPEATQTTDTPDGQDTPTSQESTPPSSSRPTSSTDSPAPTTDGPSTPSSTPPSPSSPPSGDASSSSNNAVETPTPANA